jgi:hypothetical protein
MLWDTELPDNDDIKRSLESSRHFRCHGNPAPRKTKDNGIERSEAFQLFTQHPSSLSAVGEHHDLISAGALTTRTSHWASWIARWLVLPKIREAKSPRPRVPATSREASMSLA